MQAHFAKLWEKIAELMPTRDAVVQGARRVSWREYENNAARLAGALKAAGLEPGAKVGMYLYNSPEYCETNFAALKMLAVPVNVNYRYLDDELHYLLENADAEAVVYHASLGDRIARVRARLPQLKILIEVADGEAGAGHTVVDGAEPYADLLARSTPAPPVEPTGEEIYMLYTGGTTGMPKGVMYNVREFTEFFVTSYPPMIGLEPLSDVDELVAGVEERLDSNMHLAAMSGPPLMHGTGCWLGLMAPHMMGGTAVLLESRGLDADEVWDTVAREQVRHLIIVGDAFARPLLRALEGRDDLERLGCLQLMISSGAMFSTEVKTALFEFLPTLMIADVLGSTEGGMGQALSTKATPQAATAQFMLSPTTKVFTEDGREVAPGSGESGLVASGGLVPVGYYKDPEKSARTFREVNGARYSFPGDMARVAADGTLELLGRGSNCINTGGEKVFPEEVEEALKRHPAVEDALVFGIPDERFGNSVAAVAALTPGSTGTSADILADTHNRIAGYKVPRALVLVEQVPRAPNGKADYPSARDAFTAASAPA